MADERNVIAAGILSAAAREQLLMLGEDDFTTHTTRTMAAVLRDMHRRGDTIDPATLAAALESRGELSRCGGLAGIYEMCSQLPTAVNAEFYAHRVRQATRLRMMQATTEQMRESLASEEAIGAIDELIRRRTEAESKIPGLLEADDVSGATVRALLEKTFPTDVWLVPGFMLRGDRAVITGSEGIGKAWFMRQVAACAAAGVHPFTGEMFDASGYRVLVLDCENGEKEMQESFARLAPALPDNGWQDRMFAFSRDAGIDLTRADAGWLHQKAARISPDLIVVGPAYKIMYGRDPQRDTDVLDLLLALDDVRARHNASVIVEHHAPHGSGLGERTTRPYGSSYWRRWATIGIGLAPHDMTVEGWDKPTGDPEWTRPHVLDLVRWRFMRGQKTWPDVIEMGADNELPWQQANHYTKAAA